MYLCSSLGENSYLVCTSRSLVEMEKTPERLLMNIPEEPYTGSCKRSQKNILHAHFLFTLWKYIIICTSHTQTHTHKYFFSFWTMENKQSIVFMIGQLFLSGCQRMFVSIFVPLQTHVVNFLVTTRSRRGVSFFSQWGGSFRDLFSHIVFQFCSASIFSRSAATESSPDDSVENPLFSHLASACPVYLFCSFILGCET